MQHVKGWQSYSLLSVQDLAEKLFARVHKSGGERFEMRLGMMQVCPFMRRYFNALLCFACVPLSGGSLHLEQLLMHSNSSYM